MALFRMLTHVRRFDFSATSGLYWTLLPPTFQAALYCLLSLPTITYVRLHSWVFPNFAALDSLLNHCKNLKGLALSSTTVCTDYAPPDSDDPSPSSLSLDVLTLDFVIFAHLEYWLLGRHASINVRSLRELRVAHFHDVLIVDNLLRAIGSSLEHFHLKPGMWNGMCLVTSISDLIFSSISLQLQPLTQPLPPLPPSNPRKSRNSHVLGTLPPLPPLPNNKHTPPLHRPRILRRPKKNSHQSFRSPRLSPRPIRLEEFETSRHRSLFHPDLS